MNGLSLPRVKQGGTAKAVNVNQLRRLADVPLGLAAYDCLLLRSARPDQIAGDNKAGRNANAGLECCVGVEAVYGRPIPAELM